MFAICLAGPVAALGVGGLRMQSSLGQPLKAQLEVTGAEAFDIDLNCFKASVEAADGTLLAPVALNFISQGDRRFLKLGTRKSLLEPAVKVVLKVNCEIQFHREYLVLLDPPELSTASPIEQPRTQPESETFKANISTSERLAKKDQGRQVISSVTLTRQVSEEPVAHKRKNTPQQKMSPELFLPRPANTGKDTLKLSRDGENLVFGLRSSDTLSLPDQGGTSADVDIEAIRLAQTQFAAMLRDEKLPIANTEKNNAEQQKIQSLQHEAIQLKRQIQLDKAAVEELKDTSVAKNWLYLLLVLMLGSVAVLLTLLAYVRRLHKKTASTWWEQKESKTAETRRSVEELVDHVQASYGPATTAGEHSQLMEKTFVTSDLAHVSIVPKNNRGESASLGNLEANSVFSRSYTPSLEDTNSSTFNFFSSRGHSLKVEEISDVTQEAEFWMSVNDPERAIEILEPQADQTQPESPVPWLYLLDLYRMTGNKGKYDALRDRFVVYFNANVPEFEVDPASLTVRHLDDFEHLIQKICGLWQTNDILPFLESLLIDDRDGKRIGFDLPVYRDILLLISIANELDRLKSMGEQISGWKAATDIPVAESGEDSADQSHVINFEAIDFHTKP
ncbi:type IV pilus assembly protein FimV [Undibacterium oligocarboniphilum]|uniref:FimV N-terminal domain-containing protein n=1 Tax=Undibacterium oligocarboniphilum TaxID=666702 RepID=A0A850QAQ2_9BURK|nr:hypothetical protein [Undibacterium oligocarboniphilum]MBC3868681.1 hypothetical protein [Undibacterium oligocarboniphilum]NVO76661.1 hypothetical protein [Undibacterium oligocarboniphilum]